MTMTTTMVVILMVMTTVITDDDGDDDDDNDDDGDDDNDDCDDDGDDDEGYEDPPGRGLPLEQRLVRAAVHLGVGPRATPPRGGRMAAQIQIQVRLG